MTNGNGVRPDCNLRLRVRVEDMTGCVLSFPSAFPPAQLLRSRYMSSKVTVVVKRQSRQTPVDTTLEYTVPR
jgi:hypothetical protein